MTISIDDIPANAAAACRALRDEVLGIVGEDLVAMWLHGGTTFADRPARPGDLDICAVIAGATPDERRPRRWRADPGSRPSRLFAAQDSVARRYEVIFDTVYLLADDIGSGKIPSRAFEGRRETSWPVYRAHWLSGQYVLLHGLPPTGLVKPPTSVEMRRALDRELEHLERHVLEGDAADPFEATYCTLNGCRILYTFRTGSPVISKRSAGAWGIEHLPERWHDAIRAAIRSYDAAARAGDEEVLRETMPSFVEEVRGELPTKSRPPIPRWS